MAPDSIEHYQTIIPAWITNVKIPVLVIVTEYNMKSIGLFRKCAKIQNKMET